MGDVLMTLCIQSMQRMMLMKWIMCERHYVENEPINLKSKKGRKMEVFVFDFSHTFIFIAKNFSECGTSLFIIIDSTTNYP